MIILYVFKSKLDVWVQTYDIPIDAIFLDSLTSIRWPIDEEYEPSKYSLILIDLKS